jgi:hypothetical protein
MFLPPDSPIRQYLVDPMTSRVASRLRMMVIVDL